MRKLSPQTASLHTEEGGPERKCPREMARLIAFEGNVQRNGSQFNMLARREPRCDGEGRGLRGAVVEGTDECNDPNEHDGAEAVHRLVRKVDQVSTLPQLLRCVGSLSHWRGHRRVFLDRG